MTKTKRQLRAEAVERLRSKTVADTWLTAMLGIEPRSQEWERITADEITNRLVDLLTDDEPPEGDPVRIMRECAAKEHGMAKLRDALGIDLMARWQMRCLAALADMVERDYVRREDYEDLGSANERQARKIHNVCELNEKLTAERDEWKARAEGSSDYVGLRQGKVHEGKICSEYYCGGCGWPVTDHDSYCPECGGALHGSPSKSELGPSNDGVERSNYGVKRSMTNLERLYGSDEFFNRFARWYVTADGKADDGVQADDWLMAEHAPDCGTEPAESVLQADLPDTDSGQNADMSGNAPGCARNDAFMSENGVSDGAEGSNDTREKLEADIRSWLTRDLQGNLITRRSPIRLNPARCPRLDAGSTARS